MRANAKNCDDCLGFNIALLAYEIFEKHKYHTTPAMTPLAGQLMAHGSS